MVKERKQKMEAKDKIKWLCKCEMNWADEADFTWFEIFTDEEKKEFLAYLKKHADDYTTVYFGTNEYSEFTGKDIANCLEWKKIPDETTEKFLKNFVVSWDTNISSLADFGDAEEDNDEDA